jgi:hypothetical protein
MKTVVALILAASAAFFTPASAQTVSARQNGESVTLTREACSEKVKKYIIKTHQPLFFGASAVVKGKAFTACWMVAGRDVLVIFDDGEYAVFPSDIFKKDESL